MGNCTSGTGRGKGDSSQDDKQGTTKPKEDVTYACIDHSTSKGSKKTSRPAASDADCDYSIVIVPPAVGQARSECSSEDEREDDYVLMG